MLNQRGQVRCLVARFGDFSDPHYRLYLFVYYLFIFKEPSDKSSDLPCIEPITDHRGLPHPRTFLQLYLSLCSFMSTQCHRFFSFSAFWIGSIVITSNPI